MLSKQKFSIGVASLLFLLWTVSNGDAGLLVGIDHAWAAPDTTSIFTDLEAKMSVGVSFFVSVSLIAYAILEYLIDPQLFLGIASGNDTIVHQIWQFSRDITNIIFAFILIVVALITVVTAKKDIIGMYARKFVLAVILVNFSWFFPRVILDVATVLTATVYQIPTMVSSGPCGYVGVDGATVDCRGVAGWKFGKEARAIRGSANWFCPTDSICINVVPLTNPDTPRGILGGLVLNHAHLADLASVSGLGSSLSGVSTTDPSLEQLQILLEFLVKTGFSLILAFMLGLLTIAMMVAFLIRIPILWLTMAFMPFMFIGFIIGDKMRVGSGDFNSMKIFSKFVSSAFLPAVVGVPLCLGFILINAVANSAPPPAAAALMLPTGELIPGFGNLWTLLWMIATIVLMWLGVKTAFQIDTIYSSATSGIMSIGENLGKTAALLPLNIPILPFGKGGTSIGELRLKSAQTLNTARAGKLLEDATAGAGGAAPSGAGGATDVTVFNNVKNAITVNSKTNDLQASHIRDALAGDADAKRKVTEALHIVETQAPGKSHEQRVRLLAEVLKEKGEPLSQDEINGLTANEAAFD